MALKCTVDPETMGLAKLLRSYQIIGEILQDVPSKLHCHGMQNFCNKLVLKTPQDFSEHQILSDCTSLEKSNFREYFTSKRSQIQPISD